MLQITTDKVAEVIILAREGRRGEAELAAFIEGLNEEEQVSLVALLWIGRGSFEPEELDEAMQTAREEATTPTAHYLSGSPHLPDHLENGLDALGVAVRDAENDLY